MGRRSFVFEVFEESGKELWGPQQVADSLRVSRPYVYSLHSKDPGFPCPITVSGKKYWYAEEIKGYKEQKKQEVLKQIAQRDATNN